MIKTAVIKGKRLVVTGGIGYFYRTMEQNSYSDSDAEMRWSHGTQIFRCISGKIEFVINNRRVKSFLSLMQKEIDEIILLTFRDNVAVDARKLEKVKCAKHPFEIQLADNKTLIICRFKAYWVKKIRVSEALGKIPVRGEEVVPTRKVRL